MDNVIEEIRKEFDILIQENNDKLMTLIRDKITTYKHVMEFKDDPTREHSIRNALIFIHYEKYDPLGLLLEFSWKNKKELETVIQKVHDDIKNVINMYSMYISKFNSIYQKLWNHMTDVRLKIRGEKDKGDCELTALYKTFEILRDFERNHIIQRYQDINRFELEFSKFKNDFLNNKFD